MLSSTLSVQRRCGEPSRCAGPDASRFEHFRGADGERRIEEDRRGGYGAAVHQIDEVDDQLLRALHGEGRDQQRPAGTPGGVHFLGEMRAAAVFRHRRPVGVAIGQLAEKIVEIGRPFRIGLEQLGVRPDIAGSEDTDRLALLHEFELDRGRAEHMAGVPVSRPEARQDLGPLLVGGGPEGL